MNKKKVYNKNKRSTKTWDKLYQKTEEAYEKIKKKKSPEGQVHLLTLKNYPPRIEVHIGHIATDGKRSQALGMFNYCYIYSSPTDEEKQSAAGWMVDFIPKGFTTKYCCVEGVQIYTIKPPRIF